jgi:hypothetical protein
MPTPEPQNRNEAMLLHSLIFAIADIEDRVIAFSDGGLRTGPGPRGYGLLVALDSGVVFFIDYDKMLGATWAQITGVSFQKKLIGRSITLSTTTSGVLNFRVTSPTLGREIRDLWQVNR